MKIPSSRSPRSATFKYGLVSCAIFGIELALFLATSLLFDSYLGSLSFSVQRWIGVVALVFPAAIGAVVGLIGLGQSSGSRALSLVGLILNTLFALFFSLVLAFAG